MVEINADAGADGRLGIGSISDREPGSKVRLLFWPEGWTMVGLANWREQEIIFEDSPLGSLVATFQIPGMRVHRRRDLLSVDFVGGLQYGVTHTERQCEIRSRAPGVLKKVFELIRFELPSDERTIRQESRFGRTCDFVVIA